MVQTRDGDLDTPSAIFLLSSATVSSVTAAAVDPPPVEALVRWATGKRLIDRLLELSLTTLFPPSEQRDSWSSYGAVRAYSEVLL